jgi:hypothetical protein
LLLSNGLPAFPTVIQRLIQHQPRTINHFPDVSINAGNAGKFFFHIDEQISFNLAIKD